MDVRKILVVVFSLVSVFLFGQSVSKTESVLKSGTWYKIKVAENGVYKLTHQQIKTLGIASPENIRVYGMSGKQLPYINNEEFISGLEEIPVYAGNDYFLFYGEGVEHVSLNEDLIYRQHVNEYALWNYYYITASFGSGARIQEKSESGLVSNTTVTSYDYVDYYEEEGENVNGSGRLWYAKTSGDNNYSATFSISDIITSKPVYLEVATAFRTASLASLKIKVNGNLVREEDFDGVIMSDHNALYAVHKVTKDSVVANSSEFKVSLESNGVNYGEVVYLDYITINARRQLKMNGASVVFSDKESFGEGKVSKFQLTGASSNTQVWNITDPLNTYRVKSTLSGSTLSFIEKTEQLNTYLAVETTSSFSAPILSDETNKDVGLLDESQNIHGTASPELLIVTHPLFEKQATQLANLHRQADNMTVEVFTTEQVYNEFSSGRPEAGAIRNLARLFYIRSNEQDSLKYLLLFGDGSFDNHSVDEGNPNYIPTYQSVESLRPTYTYVSDDFYGYLEESSLELGGDICIGVGRIPTASDGEDELEAQGVVDKIYQYYDPENMGDWQNNLIFVGDDGESSWDKDIFMREIDAISERINSSYPAFNHNKIYLDAYQQISSSTGASYPEVELAIEDAFKKGALIFNYMGHGGDEGITQEHVLTKTDIGSLKNAPYFPLFLTATCELAKYDAVKITEAGFSRKISTGETALLNPDGGAIALLTTTRVVYQNSNEILNSNVGKIAFEKDYQGNRLRLGDIVRLSKNASTAARKENTSKFALLGDPAITLRYGEYIVLTDSINGKPVSSVFDTINALNEVTISGYVADGDSVVMNSFEGQVYVSVFDKPYIVTTKGNDDIPLLDFEVQDKLLYRGIASVNNGRFKVTFKVPKDISYSYGLGKVSYYAENKFIDAKGFFKDFVIGGTAIDAEIDNEGPEIALYMNDENFQDGGVTDANPVLIAHVFDTNGINTTGNGIGHDLTATLDDANSNFLLNDYYVGQKDNYRRGVVRFPLYDLEDGRHTIRLKVWDTYNNSSEEELNFYVDNSNNLVVNELMSYPNPARSEVFIQYSHNSPGEEHTVFVSVYDAAGRLVHRIERTQEEGGYVSEPLRIDIDNINGAVIEPGVYPYTVNVRTSDGKEGNQSSRLIIIP